MAEELEFLIKDLLNEKNSNKEIIFEKLNSILPQANNICESSLHNLLNLYLRNNVSLPLQLNALQTFLECLRKGFFQNLIYVDLGCQVLLLANQTAANDVQGQEIWLKAFSVIEKMEFSHTNLYKARALETAELLNHVIASGCSIPQKLKALKMLDTLLQEVNESNKNRIQNIVVSLWIKHICPYMFDKSQINLISPSISISYTMLPILQLAFRDDNELFAKFAVSFEKTYQPALSVLVSKEDILYSKLWIFLSKLLSLTFNQGFQFLNMLLTVLEDAFKSQNIEVRMQGFYCWQSLIESFLQNSDKFFNEKRVKLLSLPLKANNGRTESLVELKFETWCKLFNALDSKNISFTAHSTLNHYLQFCFGPLLDQPLISYFSNGTVPVAQGKKYLNIYSTICKAFLQLFGSNKYIPSTLKSQLNYFTFDCPKIKLEYSYSKLIIDSVGECCVMLSQLQKTNRSEGQAIMKALWKTLFDSIDNLEDEALKNKCIKELCSLVQALIEIPQRRPIFFSHVVVPVFDIIVSKEFSVFKEENMSGNFFLPIVETVLKEKVILKRDIDILKKLFAFKSNDQDFLKFFKLTITKIQTTEKSFSFDKLKMLEQVWLILEEEIKKFVLDNNVTEYNEEQCASLFSVFLCWPFTTSNLSCEEEILRRWKELYSSISARTSQTLQTSIARNVLTEASDSTNRATSHMLVANITNIVICHIEYDKYREETFADIRAILSILKTFLLMDNIGDDCIKTYIKAIRHIFNSCKNYPFCLLDEILDCLTFIFSSYKDLEILEDIKNFVVSFSNVPKYRNEFERLIHILKSSHIDGDLIAPILHNYSTILDHILGENTRISRIFNNASLSDSCMEISGRGRRPRVLKPKTANARNKKDDFVRSKKSDRIMSILGHDLDTLTTVKPKGNLLKSENENNPPVEKIISISEEIFVNTPYKFDPKKLTKSQREKLARKRDDIPALYQDLSQSQTQDFGDSSTFLESDLFQKNTVQHVENPFSDLLIENNSETNIATSIRKKDTTSDTIKNLNSLGTETELNLTETALKKCASDVNQTSCAKISPKDQLKSKTQSKSKSELRSTRRMVAPEKKFEEVDARLYFPDSSEPAKLESTFELAKLKRTDPELIFEKDSKKTEMQKKTDSPRTALEKRTSDVNQTSCAKISPKDQLKSKTQSKSKSELRSTRRMVAPEKKFEEVDARLYFPDSSEPAKLESTFELAKLKRTDPELIFEKDSKKTEMQKKTDSPRTALEKRTSDVNKTSCAKISPKDQLKSKTRSKSKSELRSTRRKITLEKKSEDAETRNYFSDSSVPSKSKLTFELAKLKRTDPELKSEKDSKKTEIQKKTDSPETVLEKCAPDVSKISCVKISPKDQLKSKAQLKPKSEFKSTRRIIAPETKSEETEARYYFSDSSVPAKSELTCELGKLQGNDSELKCKKYSKEIEILKTASEECTPDANETSSVQISPKDQPKSKTQLKSKSKWKPTRKIIPFEKKAEEAGDRCYFSDSSVPAESESMFEISKLKRADSELKYENDSIKTKIRRKTVSPETATNFKEQTSEDKLIENKKTAILCESDLRFINFDTELEFVQSEDTEVNNISDVNSNAFDSKSTTSSKKLSESDSTLKTSSDISNTSDIHLNLSDPTLITVESKMTESNSTFHKQRLNEVETELNTILGDISSDTSSKSLTKPKPRKRRPRRKSFSIENSDSIISGEPDLLGPKDNLTEPSSIEDHTENTLNTAKIDINSAELDSATSDSDKPKKKSGRRPAKSSKYCDTDEPFKPTSFVRTRRSSNASLTEEPQTPEIVTIETCDNLDKNVQQRVNRELQRIKMNINNSEEYKKNQKRKTRTSGNFQSLLSEDVLSECTDDSSDLDRCRKNSRRANGKKSGNNSQSSETDVNLKPNIEISPNTQKNVKQLKVAALYHLDSVKPGEHIAIDAKTDIMKVPEGSSSPFKIVEHPDLPEKSSTCKEITFSDTPTLNSEILAEIQVENPELLYVDAKQNDAVDLSCRKVLFTTETSESLPSSPVLQDTPTRTKELISSTCEISPIKLTEDNSEKDTETTEGAVESSDIDPCVSNLFDLKEMKRVGNRSPHPLKLKRKRSLSKPLNRSAHMIDMISAQKAGNPQKCKKSELKNSELATPTQNRVFKTLEKIRREDILTFSRDLPSPITPPLPSILKKRKMDDETDEQIVRPFKRRRVNFCDPPVSCTKFIEKRARHKLPINLNMDVLPQELRVTRSSKGIEEMDKEFDTIATEQCAENADIQTENTHNTDINIESTIENIFSEKNPKDILDNIVDNVSDNIISPTPETPQNFTKNPSENPSEKASECPIDNSLQSVELSLENSGITNAPEISPQKTIPKKLEQIEESIHALISELQKDKFRELPKEVQTEFWNSIARATGADVVMSYFGKKCNCI